MSEILFKQPAVEVGMPVCWFPYGDNANGVFPGIVLQVAHETVTLACFTPDNRNHFVKEGVRHMTDPRAKQAELREQGGWAFPEWFVQLLKLAPKAAPIKMGVDEKAGAK